MGTNLRHLRYFYAVAREGGFTRASQVLRVRQPALSKMVGELESALGFQLFERHGRSLLLTTRGRQVFERAQRIFEEVEGLERSLGQISGECAGDLKFAAAEPIASHLVPVALRDLRAEHPKIYPQFVSGPASYMLSSIQNGAVELGLFFHIAELPRGLAVFERISVPFHLVVKTTHRREPRVIDSFIGSREIDDTTTRRFPTLERFRAVRPNVAIRISTNNVSAHKVLVAQGEGIAVLPSFMVASELRNGSFTDLLPKAKLSFDLQIAARETATLSLNAKGFLQKFRPHCA